VIKEKSWKICKLIHLFIEGHDEFRDRAKEIKEEGLKRARERCFL
jgi:hypothetical protein